MTFFPFFVGLRHQALVRNAGLMLTQQRCRLPSESEAQGKDTGALTPAH